MEAAFVNQAHQHGFHHIVLMMGIGNLIAALLLGGLIKAPFLILAQRGRDWTLFSAQKIISAISVSQWV